MKRLAYRDVGLNCDFVMDGTTHGRRGELPFRPWPDYEDEYPEAKFD